jgi:elongation factor 2
MMSKELAGKALQLDFHADEQERGITIDTAAVSMVHIYKDEEYLINLLDTPGHVDFGGDVTRAMRAVDGCIVLVDAVEGPMPQTETVLRQALKERVVPTLFINKVDRLIKELQLTPEKMQERFLKVIGDVNRLIGKIAEKEYGDKWQVNVQEGRVAFGSAFHNWALSIPFMKERGITFKEIIDAYQGEAEAYKQLKDKAPLHEVVLNMVIEHLPDPGAAQKYRVPKIWHGEIDSEQGKALLACDANGPLNLVITKIVVDPQAGEISAGRMYSGTIKRGDEVYLLDAKQTARVQQVYVYNGAKKEIVDGATTGNIIGVAGIKTKPGDTIADKEGREPFEQIKHIFDPVVTKSIEAKHPSDLPKLIEVLRQVQKEDPTIKIEINEETGEHLMSGMGELHLEVIENRIKTEKNVDITTSPPIVVYRESVTKPGTQDFEGKSPNKHNKLFFKVTPLPKEIAEMVKKGEVPEGRMKKKNLEIRTKFTDLGMETKVADKIKNIFNGNIFIDGTRGIVYINEIMELVLDMFEDVMNAGPLAREPCTGVMVTMTDCKLHEDAIHRGPSQMYPAVREGIRGAMSLATPVLFEPKQLTLFEAPEEYMGEISKLISNKRGQLLDMQQEQALIHVTAKMPVAEMFGFASELRSATGGRGTSSVVDQVFEKLPEELQRKIIGQIRTRKGLTANQ